MGLRLALAQRAANSVRRRLGSHTETPRVNWYVLLIHRPLGLLAARRRMTPVHCPLPLAKHSQESWCRMPPDLRQWTCVRRCAPTLSGHPSYRNTCPDGARLGPSPSPEHLPFGSPSFTFPRVEPEDAPMVFATREHRLPNQTGQWAMTSGLMIGHVCRCSSAGHLALPSRWPRCFLRSDRGIFADDAPLLGAGYYERRSEGSLGGRGSCGGAQTARGTIP